MQETRRGENTKGLVFEFIRNYIEEHRFPPTFREIMSATGLRSLATVTYHIKQLEREGRIEQEKGVNRGLRIVEHANASYGKTASTCWTRIDDDHARCSYCGRESLHEKNQYNDYCPKCGARAERTAS